MKSPKTKFLVAAYDVVQRTMWGRDMNSFTEDEVNNFYLAIVEGYLTPKGSQFESDYPINSNDILIELEEGENQYEITLNEREPFYLRADNLKEAFFKMMAKCNFDNLLRLEIPERDGQTVYYEGIDVTIRTVKIN